MYSGSMYCVERTPGPSSFGTVVVKARKMSPEVVPERPPVRAMP